MGVKEIIEALERVPPQVTYRPDVIIVPRELMAEVEEALKYPFELTEEDREYYRLLGLI